MARLKASIKDIRTSRRNKMKNVAVKTKMKKAIKDAKKAIVENKEAKEKIKKAISMIDKAVVQGVLHRNTGANKKSRLMMAHNKASKK